LHKIEQKEIIKALREDIWSFITNPDNFSKYIDNYLGGEFLTEHETGEGATFRWYTKFMGFKLKSEEKVIIWKENKRVEYEGDMAGAWFHSQMILTPVEEGVEFKVIIEYKMPYWILGKFLDFIYFHHRVRKDVSKSIQNVQRQFEKN